MVKHDHKRQKNKTGSLLYNITTSEDKTERNLIEGKFLLKPSFKKEKTNLLSTRRYRIFMSQIDKLILGIWLLKLKVLVFCRFILLFKSTFSHKRPSWTNKWKLHTFWMSLAWAIISACNSNLVLCYVFHERGFI